MALWFHYNTEKAQVVITKDGENVADDMFDVDANELLECDMSECGEGEYVVIIYNE